MTSANHDQWARWLLQRRDAGDPYIARQVAPQLAAFRDGVLERAAVADGDVLLDVGTGTGLVGLAALDRVGPTGQVIFSDISTDLLDECRRQVAARGLPDRCRFLSAAADDLRGIGDRSVDVVTTRSVLLYVERKRAAFAEFFRVLRPGGRLAVFEPINSFGADETSAMFLGLDMTPITDLTAKVRRAYQCVATSAMLTFDERDLLRWVREAGFSAVELDYRAMVQVPEPPPTAAWEVLRKTAPNPLAPTYEEALAQTLTDQERERFENHVRAVLAAGTPARRTFASVFLRAVRP